MFFFLPHVLNSAGKLWPPEVLTSLMPWAAIVHGFRPMRFYIREVRTRRNHGWQIVGNCWKSSFCSISVQNTIARDSVINLYTNSNFTGAKLTISEYLKYSRTVFPRCIEHNHAIVDFAPHWFWSCPHHFCRFLKKIKKKISRFWKCSNFFVF